MLRVVDRGRSKHSQNSWEKVTHFKDLPVAFPDSGSNVDPWRGREEQLVWPLGGAGIHAGGVARAEVSPERSPRRSVSEARVPLPGEREDGHLGRVLVDRDRGGDSA